MKKLTKIFNKLNSIMREKVNELEEDGSYADAKLEMGTYQEGYSDALEDFYQEYSKSFKK